MKKLWVIIQREYLTRVKRKSFLLTTIALPLAILGFYALMFFIALGGGGTTTKRVAVVDNSGYFKNQLTNSKSITFSYPDEEFESLKARLDKTDYSGILYVPEINIYKVNDNIKYYSDNKLGLASKEYIHDELARKIRNLRMENQGLDKRILDSLNVDLQLAEVSITTKDESTNEAASELLSGIGYVMGFVLYFVLIIFGTMVMKGVKEEKTNRIVEVIVSSVKPFQLMLGKILGISLVGITQFLIWGVLFYAGYFLLFPILLTQMNIDPAIMEQSSASSDMMQDLDGMEQMILSLTQYDGYGKLILGFLFYFFGGYFIYASLFSAVGSAVSDDTESQQLAMPVMMPIILSLVVLTTLFNDPNNSLAVWTSIFPLTSPIIMPARIPFDPPLWQIILSAVSLIVGALFFVWISAKIYRTGILMYGKKINAKEIFKWLRY